MTLAVPVYTKPSPWQVTVGAEGIAAAQFARCGFDVSIQSGRERPWYDLVVSKAGYLLKVSVKGSEDGSWALTEAYLKRAADLHGKRASYEGAIDLWRDHHGSRAVCCLVQFKGVSIDELPRIYLASPDEVAQELQEAVERVGCPTLYERYDWIPEGSDSLTTVMLPPAWNFSEARIQELLTRDAKTMPRPALLPKRNAPSVGWQAPIELTRIQPVAIGFTA